MNKISLLKKLKLLNRMKKISILLSICIGLFSCEENKKGCTDPNSINYNPDAEINSGCNYPTNDQNTICVFFTDVNSSTCGTFGIPLFANVKNNFPSDVYFIAAHPNISDGLQSSASVSLASIINISAVPNFAVGSTGGLVTQTNIEANINASLTSSSGNGVFSRKSFTSDSIIIENYGKLTLSTLDTFFIANYVTEDDVSFMQNGIVGTHLHQSVLRLSTGSSGLGEQLTFSSVSQSGSFKKRYSLYIQPTWNTSKIKVISVIWKKVGATLTFINATGV